MLFKNASIYLADQSVVTDVQDVIQNYKAKDCLRTERHSLGFVDPVTLDPNGELIQNQSGLYALCIRFSERVLPSACVKKELDNRIKATEETGLKVSPSMKRLIKDQVELDMLPQAFQRDSFTHIAFNSRRNWLVINSASTSRCEDALGLIRSLLGGLPVMPLASLFEHHGFFTDWINEGAPEPFSTQAYAVYEFGDKKVTMQGDLIDVPFGSVSKLDLGYREDMYFRMDDYFRLSKISYGGIITERDSEDDPKLRFGSELSISIMTIICMFDDLLSVSGAAKE